MKNGSIVYLNEDTLNALARACGPSTRKHPDAAIRLLLREIAKPGGNESVAQTKADVQKKMMEKFPLK